MTIQAGVYEVRGENLVRDRTPITGIMSSNTTKKAPHVRAVNDAIAAATVIRPESSVFALLADMQDKVQAAMDAAGVVAATDGTCGLALDRTYSITGNITGRDGVQVYGTGKVIVTAGNHGFNFSGRSRWSVTGVKIVGNDNLSSGRSAALAAIYASGSVTDAIVDRIEVTGWSNFSVFATGAAGISVLNSRFRENKGWFPRLTYTATAGSLAGPYAAHNENYSVTSLDNSSRVLVNGIRKARTAYTIDNSAKTITFVSGSIPVVGDTIEIMPYYNGVEVGIYDSQSVFLRGNSCTAHPTQAKGNALECHQGAGGGIVGCEISSNIVEGYWGNGIGLGAEVFTPADLNAMTRDGRVFNNIIRRCGSYAIKFKTGSNLHAFNNAIEDPNLYGEESAENSLGGAILFVYPINSSARGNTIRVSAGNLNANDGIRLLAVANVATPYVSGWAVDGNIFKGLARGYSVRILSCRAGHVGGNYVQDSAGFLRIDAGSSTIDAGRCGDITVRGNHGKNLSGVPHYIDRSDFITIEDNWSDFDTYGCLVQNSTNIKVRGTFANGNRSNSIASIIRFGNVKDSEVRAKVAMTYKAWVTGAAYEIGDYRTSAGSVYIAMTAGVAGATAPVHLSGTANDGSPGVTWQYVWAAPVHGAAFSIASTDNANIVVDGCDFSQGNILPMTADNLHVVTFGQNKGLLDGPRENPVLNGQCVYWPHGTSFVNPAHQARLAAMFSAALSPYNASGVRTITQEMLPAGTSFASGSRNFIRWTETDAGTGYTTKGYVISIPGAHMFAGQQAMIEFMARAPAGQFTSPNNGIRQHFGTGGSPSALVTETVPPFVYPVDWKMFRAIVNIPSDAGKTYGSNGDDSVQILLLIPVAQALTFDLGEVWLVANALAERRSVDAELAAVRQHVERKTVRTPNGTQFYSLVPKRRAPTITKVAGATTATLANPSVDGFSLTHNADADLTILATCEPAL